MKQVLLLTILCLGAVSSSYLEYDLVQIIPSSQLQRDTINEFINKHDVDVWKMLKDGPIDMLVTHEQSEYLHNEGFTVVKKLSGEEIETLIRQQKSSDNIRAGYNPDVYSSLDEIYAFYDHILERHSDVAQAIPIGISSLGENITAMMIANELNNTDTDIILVTGGFHARDWVSVYVATDLMHSMIMRNSYYPETRFIFVPVLNVDGYRYTWESSSRLWFKTRSYTGDDVCFGIDPNRNFDSFFGYFGASTLKCSDYYNGEDAEDEPVTAALSDFMRDNLQNIKAYIDIQSYGQRIMYPYSYSPNQVEDFTELNNLALESQKNETSYEVGSRTDFYDYTSGAACDFAYDNGVKWVYVIETRDKGEYGYLLPENQLDDAASEAYTIYQIMIDEILSSNK